jgi:tryptophanyl-tRNA synthetase
LKPIQERAAELSRDPLAIKSIVANGCKRAQETAEATLTEVRTAVGLDYH